MPEAAAAGPHPGAPLPRGHGGTCARACDPSAAPRLGGSREGRGRLRPGAEGYRSGTITAATCRWRGIGASGRVAGGGSASGQGPRRGRLSCRVRPIRDSAPGTPRSPRGRDVMSPFAWCAGSEILSLGVGLQSCLGDRMRSGYLVCGGVAGHPRSPPQSPGTPRPRPRGPWPAGGPAGAPATCNQSRRWIFHCPWHSAGSLTGGTSPSLP